MKGWNLDILYGIFFPYSFYTWGEGERNEVSKLFFRPFKVDSDGFDQVGIMFFIF